MKATVLIIVAALTITGCVAEASAAEEPGNSPAKSPNLPWYYQSPCQQPAGTTLHEWLAALEPYGELVAHGWDCSQTSAYIEWLAENCGHDAVITCRRATAKHVGHCWVTVDGNPYEATEFGWAGAQRPGYYEADIWFLDIYEAWAFTKYNKRGEWGWWATYPELRSE